MINPWHWNERELMRRIPVIMAAVLWAGFGLMLYLAGRPHQTAVGYVTVIEIGIFASLFTWLSWAIRHRSRFK